MSFDESFLEELLEALAWKWFSEKLKQFAGAFGVRLTRPHEPTSHSGHRSSGDGRFCARALQSQELCLHQIASGQGSGWKQVGLGRFSR